MAPPDETMRWRIEQLERRLERMTDEKADSDDLEGLRSEMRTVSDLLNGIRIEVATIRTKIGFWSAIGSLAGAGIVTVIVALGSNT